MPSTANHIIAQLLGLCAFLACGVIAGIAYVILVGRVLNRGGDGFGIAGAVVVFPWFGGASGLGWIILRMLHDFALGRMSATRVAFLSGTLGLLAAIVLAGPRGFTLHPGAVLFNYFLIAIVVGGAAAHHGIVMRLARSTAP